MTAMGQHLLGGVNTPLDPANLTDLEKKHLPVITAPDEVKADECFEVEVEVGQLLRHPNEPTHFIQFIELYAGDVYLARLSLSPVTTCPILKTCARLSRGAGPLRAREVCNLHGLWEAERAIRVV